MMDQILYLYARVAAGGDIELAKQQLRAQLREKVRHLLIADPAIHCTNFESIIPKDCRRQGDCLVKDGSRSSPGEPPTQGGWPGRNTICFRKNSHPNTHRHCQNSVMGFQTTFDFHPCVWRSRRYHQGATIRPRGGDQLFGNVDVLHHPLGNRGMKLSSTTPKVLLLITCLAGYSSICD